MTRSETVTVQVVCRFDHDEIEQILLDYVKKREGTASQKAHAVLEGGDRLCSACVHVSWEIEQ